MSNIIKGQRIRNESDLKIRHIKANNPAKKPEFIKDESKENFTLREVEDAKDKARIIIKKAKTEKDRLIEETNAELKQQANIEREKAKEEGYANGYSVGYSEGQEAARELIDKATQELESAQVEKENILKSLEPEVLDLVLNITEKLISDEISHNKDLILVLIKQALGNLEYDADEIMIKVSPDNYDYVLGKIDQLKQPGQDETIKIAKDSKLSVESCIIETPFGSIKSSVDKSFKEIKKQMRLIYDKGE